MNFDESLSFLLSLGNEVLAMKLGLESTEKLLAALGNPQKKILKVQIAGTNGKGSTCAFLEAICRSAGVRTGLTTSPHLVSITERIKIDGAEISRDDFARHATKIREICEKLVEAGELEALPTFFEQITAIAISAFAEAEVELAILETGLGGRFDSVTAARAEIVGITPIDFDHQSVLGNSLAEIAAEKAAIIREDTRVAVSKQAPEALEVIIRRCLDAGVEPLTDACQFDFESSGQISFKTKNEIYPAVRLSLPGRHQAENACLAINLAGILSEDFGLDISQQSVLEGLQTAVHRGRLEFFKGILFDGAHNVAGAKALRNFLQEFCKDRKITLVFGAMKDKDLSKIAEILFPLAETLILTKPDNPRSANLEDLRQIAGKFLDRSKVFAHGEVADAIEAAQQKTAAYPGGTKASVICVTGSLYLVGEAQRLLSRAS